MILTAKQEEGLKIALERYRHGEKYTVISGYAGVGKTTLVNFIISALGLDPENEVAYVAYTGKASEVLREKGNPNATTAHRLLYYSKQMPNGKFYYSPRSSIPYRLVVVDEISMLPKDMWDLLLTHNAHVIACGDPFQIPPIAKDQDNHVLDYPHIFLDEVMRQAKESDIICLSMDIRQGKSISPYRGNDAQVFYKKNLKDGMYFWADQILVSTNRTRYDINTYMREVENRGPEPEVGDKIICLRNSWDTVSEKNKDPLINGTIGWIESLEPETVFYNFQGRPISANILRANITTQYDRYIGLPIDYKALTTGEKTFTPQQEYHLRKDKSNPTLPMEFNYGYSITGHKAQGSQWPKVLVMEESFPFAKEEHARWLYTCCTRPSDKLTLILKS